MGKGRDKRKKHEDPAKAAARLAKQAAKLAKHESRLEAKAEGGGGAAAAVSGGFNGEEAIEATLTRLKKSEAKRKTVTELAACAPPSPRANSAVIAHPTRDNEVVMFGGELWNGEVTTAYNDLYIYNTAKNQWSQIVAPLPPAPRSSVQVVAYKHFLIYQGGEFVSQSQSQFLHFRDTWRFDTNSCTWDEYKCKSGPSARSGHRMVLWKRNAVLFAGFYDNALETKYYNDLWIFSDLDGAGSWRQILFSAHAEQPEPRSGHSMGLYGDKLFVYGGYSTQKFNRFKKSEATVHHDLWSIDLAAPVQVWTKIKLAGIPPPIRSGVSSVFKDKRLYLFGGVVDIDAPGGKTMSAFHNDLFAFHMDTQRFFPIVLQQPAAPGGTGAAGAGAAPPPAASSKHVDPTAALAAELAALGVDPKKGRGGGASSSDESSDDDEDDVVLMDKLLGGAGGSSVGLPKASAGFRSTTTSAPKPSLTAAAIVASGADAPTANGGGGAADQPPKTSCETLPTGQTLPCPRMDAHLCTIGNTLVVMGGQYEVGKKEVTLMDAFTLNLNRPTTYVPLVVQDLDKLAWVGKESEASEGSWEDGSTVASFTSELERMHELEDEEDEEGSDEERSASGSGSSDEDDDDGSDGDGGKVPKLVAAAAAASDRNIDGRTTVKGKRGVKAHKAQLEAQLGAGSLVPTPRLEESLKDFYARTEAFWHRNAVEACGGSVAEGAPIPAKLKKRVREDAMLFCRLRYEEAIELLQQLRDIEERQREEDELLRQQLRAKKEAAAAAAAAAADGAEDDQ